MITCCIGRNFFGRVQQLLCSCQKRKENDDDSSYNSSSTSVANRKMCETRVVIDKPLDVESELLPRQSNFCIALGHREAACILNN